MAWLERPFLRKFIEIYKSLPELWLIKGEFYHNKPVKQKAYETLLEKLKEVEPDATIDVVKKKINTIRTCYSRELKKIKQSEESGLDDEVYKTSLWYYNDLNFLRHQDTQKDENSMQELEKDDSLSEVSVLIKSPIQYYA